jgi:hypothetical protein
MVNDKIIELYKNRYEINNFYHISSYLIKHNPIFFETTESGPRLNDSNIECVSGDIRVDLPICFGNPNSKFKIVVMGLEPRNSNSKFNLERYNNYIYGTPFGIERWNFKNKYYKSFKELFQRKDVFVYFTDVVKEYEIKTTKNEADKNARKTFWDKANSLENIDFLKSEITIIGPTHIIALGIQSYRFLEKHFGNNVIAVTHPSARQSKLTKENAWDVIDMKLRSLFVENNI